MKPHDILYGIIRSYIIDHFADDEVRALVLGHVRARNIGALSSISTTLRNKYIISKEGFRHLRQLEAFVKKASINVDDDACTVAARESFYRGERLCRITNKRLDHYYTNPCRLDPELHTQINRAERYIGKVLGTVEPFIESIPRLIRLTGGASAHANRNNSQPHMKLQGRIPCTRGAVPYVHAIAKFHGYDHVRTAEVVSNRVTFVPKSWKTHRTIACEPVGNLPFQLAFDMWGKGCLRKQGINLSSQKGNQLLARLGSVDGSFATIDLSMASDTLSYNTVAWLLPQPWFQFLTSVRAPVGRLDSEAVRYAKFSSMGNGATFVLETLIFASFCYAVGSRDHLVYGDDIVIRTEYVADLMKLLRFFGFIPNPEKSFSSGPFRESCGTDWYKGEDVTPVYIQDLGLNKPALCHLINSVASVCKPRDRKSVV